jgi:hypothetical protein
VFGRKRRRADESAADDETTTGLDETGAEETEPGEAATEADAAATGLGAIGPWDSEDAPGDDLARLDLGSLLIPTLPGVELRVDANPEGEVIAATLMDGVSGLQVGAFAAPRTEGIWAEIRGEIFESLRAQGGPVHEQDGPFGAELVAKVPTPEGKQDARFVGIDGRRWFLRGVFTGPAATNGRQAELLERTLREVVVVRGDQAMPVRDPLPMAVPREAFEQQPDGGAEDQGTDQTTLPPPERGPEITETR